VQPRSGLRCPPRPSRRRGDRRSARPDDLLPADQHRVCAQLPDFPRTGVVDAKDCIAANEDCQPRPRSDEAPSAAAKRRKLALLASPDARCGSADDIRCSDCGRRRRRAPGTLLHSRGHDRIECLERTRRNDVPAPSARRHDRPNRAGRRCPAARSAAPGSAPTSVGGAAAWRRSAGRLNLRPSPRAPRRSMRRPKRSAPGRLHASWWIHSAPARVFPNPRPASISHTRQSS
jgi:hypothetical protein